MRTLFVIFLAFCCNYSLIATCPDADNIYLKKFHVEIYRIHPNSNPIMDVSTIKNFESSPFKRVDFEFEITNSVGSGTSSVKVDIEGNGNYIYISNGTLYSHTYSSFGAKTITFEYDDLSNPVLYMAIDFSVLKNLTEQRNPNKLASVFRHPNK